MIHEKEFIQLRDRHQACRIIDPHNAVTGSPASGIIPQDLYRSHITVRKEKFLQMLHGSAAVQIGDGDFHSNNLELQGWFL